MPDPVLDHDRDFSELRSDQRPAPPRNGGGGTAVVATVLVVALVGAGYAWWRWQASNAPAEQATSAAPPEAAAPASAPVAAASEPAGPQNLIDPLAPAEAATLPDLAESDAAVAQALTELLGQPSVGSFLQLDGFVRRAVATVDNLPRAQAPSRMWPVQLAPRRFSVEGVPGTHGQLAIAGGNAGRYSAFVAFAEAIPVDQAVALYARLYPLFQQAYEELGYPGKYFNDRLVAVLDHLLKTPEPTGPLLVELTEVKGEVTSTRPWVRYEFVDPQLQGLSSGQKMLVRMGPENEKRLKARLAEFRKRVATGVGPKAVGKGAQAKPQQAAAAKPAPAAKVQ
ncbi:Protein of unknown function (DUF3014) [Acidovorax sp. CF316]|uniref:DUF3014 domain-containing protein n=1 Tax=Acidovorax sp. CF316 TaxID=1144317 RepID=UPI00026BDECA|nr:DUF3014 domain-containing protein [Acidovorax sp. CF316]EJE52502.1 Protein of unknown function (DUF3014) [Acidovorax sp. CF316]